METSGHQATLTLKVDGLLNETRWTVELDRGTIDRPDLRVPIVFKSGDDVTRVAPDTITVHLTDRELRTFQIARHDGDVLAIISDGARMGYVSF